jgi:hypothetical protein
MAKLSRGLANLGTDSLFEYVGRINKNVDNPLWVSVGSGDGNIEAELENRTGKKFICIDPDPQSYSDTVVRPPNYKTVQDMLSDTNLDLYHQENPIIAFINWPSPNSSDYDIETIRILKPDFVVTVVEVTGASGGKCFLSWLNKCGINTANTDVVTQEPPYYVISESSVADSSDKSDIMGCGHIYKIIFLSKKQHPITFRGLFRGISPIPDVTMERNIIRKFDSCILM